MHDFDLKNRYAIITGGAQGFGLDIAKRFIKSGSKVRIWDIDEKTCAGTYIISFHTTIKFLLNYCIICNF